MQLDQDSKKITIGFFFLRVTVFLVMLMWTVDKLVRPDHASSVFRNFYYLEDVGNSVMMAIGGIELLILFGFLCGLKKKFTYGFVLVAHTISTLSSFKQYLSPFEGPNLLFFAAWPMLAACFVLYLARERDTLLVVK